MVMLYIFIHRISATYIIKIADFGMSRQVEESDYYKIGDISKPLPIRLMATESLESGKYSHKSDDVVSSV